MKLLAIAGAAIVAFGHGRLWRQRRRVTPGRHAGAKKTVKVGLAYDIGGRGDKSFNDAAAAGLEKAKSELNIETKELRGQRQRDRERQVRAAQAALRRRLQPGHRGRLRVRRRRPERARSPRPPRTARTPSSRIIDDASVTAANVASLIFAEEQGSFLVGAAAALKSKTGTSASSAAATCR